MTRSDPLPDTTDGRLDPQVRDNARVEMDRHLQAWLTTAYARGYAAGWTARGEQP